MNSNNDHQFAQDDFSAALFQRTEELDLIKNAKGDSSGGVHRNAIILESAIILPHMVSPLFIPPGKNLEAIIAAQRVNETILGIIPDPKKGNRFLEIGI